MAVIKTQSWLFPQLMPFILLVQFFLLMEICLLCTLESILVTFFHQPAYITWVSWLWPSCCQMPS